MSKYKYLAVDAQYYLHRNFEALKSRSYFPMAVNLTEEDGKYLDHGMHYLINKYEFSSQDLVKHFFWTVAKMVRENIDCDKVILLWDFPPYHKLKYIEDYKGTRVHHHESGLEDWDVESDPQGYLQEKELVRIGKIKVEAKWWIINHLHGVGMPSILQRGYEADDLAYLFSKIVDSESQLNAVCSVDSDWLYWITPNVHWYNSNRKEFWNYQDAIDDCEGVTTQLGLTNFEMKKWMDSTFYSHNDLPNCTNLGWKDFPRLYTEIQNGDYSNITDRDLLERNLKTFDIESYPQYEETVDMIERCLNVGSLSKSHYNRLVMEHGFQVSESYIDTFFSYLDPNLYEGTDNS